MTGLFMLELALRIKVWSLPQVKISLSDTLPEIRMLYLCIL